MNKIKYKNRKDYLLHEPLKPIVVSYKDMSLAQRKRTRKMQIEAYEKGYVTIEMLKEAFKEYPLPSDEGYDGD